MDHVTSHTRRKLSVTIVALVVLSSLSVAVLRAQGRSPIAQIEQKIDSVIEVLDAVVNPRSQSVTLSTSLVIVSLERQRIACNAVNVSLQPITVKVAAIDFLGRVRRATDLELAPGEGNAAFESAQDTNDFLRCRFRFVGRPTDIRAALLVYTDEDRPTTVASVPAQ